MRDVPRKSITFESLVEMFQEIESATPWDLANDMLWGYFFTHSEPGKLEQAAEILSERGFSVVDIRLSEKEDPCDQDMYWLHVERLETHTPETLDARNDSLYMLAHELDLDSYDGMDVGPPAS